MIYYVRCTETNVVKIGFAKDPLVRLVKIRSDAPTEVELIAVEEGDKGREAELHQRFGHLRKRGEWFHYNSELAAHVATLTPMAGPAQRKRKPLQGPLGSWLTANGLTLVQFAEQCETSHQNIQRICSGRVPRPALVARIARETNGEVTANHLFGIAA